MNKPLEIDLHCHLDGAFTKECMERLLGRSVAPEELQAPENCSSLGEYLQKFDLPLSCMQTRDGLRIAAASFLRSMKERNMDYVEVRFAPALSCRQGLTCRQVTEAVLEGLREEGQHENIRWNVIVCAMRHHDQETNLNMLKECREFLGAGVCAADLAGDESGFPTYQFREVFTYAKRLEYPFTIHAGECGSAQSILDAVSMGASRIGHGIAMRHREDLMQVCKERRIGIEMCPKSNYQTKALHQQEIYPLREFLNHGLLATINTDNPTVSQTSLSQERDFLKERFGITDQEIQQCRENAIEVSFAEDSLKQELWKLNFIH